MDPRQSASTPEATNSVPTSSASSRATSEDETLVGDGLERVRPQRALGRGDPVGRYLLLDALGQGAMGQVFRAYDPDLDRQIALKILFGRADDEDSEHRTRRLGEAKAMARIDHPNVVTVHDAGMHEGSVFIAMEIVDGPSLERWLETPRRPAEILDVLTDAARGLAAAHAAGVVHRDFKPANVLVTTDGRAKVGDFGLAGIEEGSSADATTSGRAMGTPAYMSPEHVAGAGIDARSDQFSFAITLYEALHGARPFSATTWPALASQIVTGQTTLAARSRGIDGIIRRALRVEPEQRFATMDALILAIERARRPAWRRFAGVGVLLLVGGLLVLGPRDDADACEAGARRVEAWWNPRIKAALQIGGEEYTESFSRDATIRFEQALDDYAARWSSAYVSLCATVGPRAQRGTPAQQRTAQCLDNRLDSLQGLAELATAGPLDAARVGDLVGTLPALHDCDAGRFIPYPADPELASRAAELHRRLAEIRRTRIADQGVRVEEETRTAVEEARDLGEPYLLARALSEYALAVEGMQDVAPVLGEALEISLAGGFERLTVEVVNHVLTTRSQDQSQAWRELGHVVAMARGLVEHSGGDERLLGYLALHESNVLRQAGRYEEASARSLRAEEHLARAEDHEGVALAHLGQALTLASQGQLDEAIPRLGAAAQELEQVTGMASPRAFNAQGLLIVSLSYAGRTREAYETAADAYRRARQLYSRESGTLRRAMILYTGAALNTGASEVAREGVTMLRELPHPPDKDASEIDLLELGHLQIEGRHEDALQAVPAMRARLQTAGSGEMRALLELSAGASLFVLGQHDAARAAIASPVVLRGLEESRSDENLRSMALFMAALIDVSPPAGTTWGAWKPTGVHGMAINRELLAVFEAFEAADDPTPTVQRVRRELVSMYHDRDLFVQVLDAWLAGKSP